LVRPVTVHEVVAVVHVNEPGDDVTVYPVTELPPLSVGAVHDTTACVEPNRPDTPVGAPGTVAGTTAALAAVYALSPAMFVDFAQNT